ncbi:MULTISPECIES: acyl-CoA dehydrogenase family protein [unclassified Paraburkholderia]|uniref:acyl-CoA dehydrogenase family protein n=1 Tax=unclassified Paraburkholderia TaxID=2615204 RepID=UPI002AB7900B|nr:MULTISPECIES: acyl-CoA dehydrogenase family protein [unclassified Paraburkholderia]
MFENYQPAWMTDDLLQFRDAARRFAREQLETTDLQCREVKRTSREAWRAIGALGMILPDVPEEYGGSGGTPAHAAIVFDEFGYSGNTGLGLGIGMNHIVAHYVLRYGTEAQKQCWLPGMASGELIAAIAMTEPGTGSDLQGVRTRAERRGESYVINGAKTFISNGQQCDVVLVVTKTDPTLGSKGISLVLVDANTRGFRRGKALDKIGLESQDTSEMFFDDCTVSADCLLGGVEGQGFYQLMQQLPYERAQLALNAVGAMRRAFDLTVDYVKERKAFGKAIGDFQNTRFVLADVKATLTASCAFADQIVQQWVDGKLDPVTASMGKFWITERQGEVMDKCLQLFGGYGYMKEYPIARMYADARVQRIYGGTNEIQRELVGRSL